MDGTGFPHHRYPGYEFGRGYNEQTLPGDYEGLFNLLSETKEAFAPSGRVITMAYYPDGRQEALLAQGGAPDHVDLFHAMAYDARGEHSTFDLFEKATSQGLARLPPQQVTVGLPFYGRSTKTGDW